MLLHRKIQPSWFVWTSGAGLKEFRNNSHRIVDMCFSINNKRSLLRFQSTTAPTNRGWSACGRTILSIGSSNNKATVFTLILLTRPSWRLLWTLTIRPRGQGDLGYLSSTTRTMSPTAKLLEGFTHFCVACNCGRYSRIQRCQNTSADTEPVANSSASVLLPCWMNQEVPWSKEE